MVAAGNEGSIWDIALVEVAMAKFMSSIGLKTVPIACPMPCSRAETGFVGGCGMEGGCLVIAGGNGDRIAISVHPGQLRQVFGNAGFVLRLIELTCRGQGFMQALPGASVSRQLRLAQRAPFK